MKVPLAQHPDGGVSVSQEDLEALSLDLRTDPEAAAPGYEPWRRPADAALRQRIARKAVRGRGRACLGGRKDPPGAALRRFDDGEQP